MRPGRPAWPRSKRNTGRRGREVLPKRERPSERAGAWREPSWGLEHPLETKRSKPPGIVGSDKRLEQPAHQLFMGGILGDRERLGGHGFGQVQLDDLQVIAVFR